MPQQKTSPSFSFEKKLWRKGFRFVVGVDEVGRGAWAGPLVAAAVIWQRDQNFQFPNSNFQIRINDSKRLKPRQRELAATWIKENCLAWTVGEVRVGFINKYSIGKATAKAMRKAIKSIKYKVLSIKQKSENLNTCYLLPTTKYFLLVDGFHVKYLPGGKLHQRAIIHGDQKSISIAAASILAKVYRDKLMVKLAKKYLNYRWGANKGYGTKLHQKAILRYGLTRFHRRQFIQTWLDKREKKE